MKDVQARLDKGADLLAMLMKQAEEGAEEACSNADFDMAKDLHLIAAHLRMAYGIGRGLRSSGGVVARAGGK